MIAHCPKVLYPGIVCGNKLIWQQSMNRYWCPKCNKNWSFREAHLIGGGKQ